MPSLRRAARARIAWLLLAAVLAGQAGCRQQGPHDNAVNGQNEVEQAPSRLPLPEPPLDRAALLMAIAKVASAHATGADQTEDQRLLDGKPFELRIRFGCGGPSPDLRKEPFGWTYDGEERTLRVQATPTISQQDEVAAQIGGDAFEAIEGFWLARPWLLESACPVTAQAAAAPSADATSPAEPEADSAAAPAAPAVGIAQFFATTDSRTRQRS